MQPHVRTVPPPTPCRAQKEDERREEAMKVGDQVGSIWDQLHHVENSLSQRMALSENSQVAALQVGCGVGG